MIKNIIFDFGNVLGQFYPEKFTANYVSDEETNKYIADIVFDRLYWDKLDDGTISDDEVKDGIRSRIRDDLKDAACMVYDNWIKDLVPVSGMSELAKDLHKSGKKIYLLSNISIRFKDECRNVKWIKELFDCFDGLVFSGPLGMVKPNAEIFDHLLTTYNLNAEECFFIDDNENNIEAAKKLNINAYLFDGDAQKLRNYLQL